MHHQWKHIEIFKIVQRRAPKICRFTYMNYEKRFEELDMLSIGKNFLIGDMSSGFKNLNILHLLKRVIS